VLPFVNLSADPNQEYFSDGITGQIISDLSRLPGLFVIARDSSFAYKGKAVKDHEIGTELGVKYVRRW
jgi:TolB-like protein